MELNLFYVHSGTIGYGRAGVYIADELRRRGVDLYDWDGVSPSPPSKAGPETSGRRAPETPTNAVCWVSVPTHANRWRQGQHKSIVTMFESMRIPEAFRDTIHEFDLLMVPSWQNVELFSQHHDNVQFLPLGVDPEQWHYIEPPKVGQTFNFLIAGRGERKGVDIAYRAFRTVFGHWWTFDENNRPVYTGPSDKPIPQLWMKSLKGLGDYYGPGVTQIPGKLEPDEERDLYAAAHCYLQPSRGEGFGLQPLQALALGRPTILTDAHGHESYAHLGIGISAVPTKAGEFIYGDAGDWWEPDYEEVCEAMWDVYQNYDSHTAKARASAENIAHNWTWSNTADRFLELLGDEMSVPYSGDGTWVEPERKLYKIIVTEDHYSEAANTARYFAKGQVYYDLADMKRILFDAGKLDPACFGDGEDNGLAPVQVAQFKEYEASHSHCPTCGQQLNTLPTRADELEEQYNREAACS